MKKKKMNKKKSKKDSFISLIIGAILLVLSIAFLPKLNNIFWESGTSKVDSDKEEKEEVPNVYKCSYGPSVDSFYNYIKSEYVVFNFDEAGNIDSLDLEIKYQVTSLDEYNRMLNLLSIDSENVTYDADNYVVTVRSNESTVFPQNYRELKQYLSKNQYTCVVE